ncbi:MAG: bifunctional demethylmenaquinone methyltransferase/2-methoxy-6-polyprenyl-1,4-benzoquinol methylase UbiE [Muribaculaceae bacterium]|nr:bifunctional demethylmenaquinone methyltransferase/2-methoxy-6-polyprenyl-1,4-benzoquinol methylase UbiE [Muribaculaceae bacterium]MBR3766495.1 bifunctional demethylmenaquinone methyltransferase/2-methoxy-6-polyprenyl-1,4-benzoquinol methylase UbiE [Muribaculaceae bacterium]
MDVKAEKINPYDNDRAKTEQVKEMFDSIAPAYDFMNRAMTFGIDKCWRAKAVKMIKAHTPKNILDVATGTGDLAIKLARDLRPQHITGIDLSEGMITIGRKKVSDAKLNNVIDFVVGDCLDLPFQENAFDCITVAYGVRNFEHLDKGYCEMHRVLKSGGVLCVIELSTPISPIIRPLYNFYTRCIIPFVGRLISKDVRAYSYLPESIAAVPQGDEMLHLMREAGFNDCSFKRLTFGTCTIYLAVK